jgi:hypothetical protein
MADILVAPEGVRTRGGGLLDAPEYFDFANEIWWAREDSNFQLDRNEQYGGPEKP